MSDKKQSDKDGPQPSSKPVRKGKGVGDYRRGRKTWVPTEQQRMRVQVMVACGYPLEEIRRTTIGPDKRPIGNATLHRAFRQDIDAARAMMIARVAQKVYDKAMGDGPDSMKACELILRCIGKWAPAAPLQEHHMLGRFSHEQTAAPVTVPLMTLDDFYAERITSSAIAAAASSATDASIVDPARRDPEVRGPDA